MLVDIADGKFTVEATNLQVELMKSVPGAKYVASERIWTLPLTYPVWIHFFGVCGSYITDVSSDVRKTVAHWHSKELALFEAKNLTDADGNPNLRPLQRVAVNWLDVAGSGVIADDFGSGKTPTAASVISDSDTHVLVICPRAVTKSWFVHVNEWTDKTPILCVGNATQRRRAIDQWKEDGGVLIMNYSTTHIHSRLRSYPGVSFKRCTDCGGLDPKVKPASCQVHSKDLNEFPIDLIIADEVHRIKDPKAIQSRAVWWLATQADRRVGLTATPIGKAPDDFWSVLRFIDPGSWPSKTRFLDRYCLMAMNYATGHEYPVGLKPEAKEEFYRVRDMYMLRRSFLEVTGRDIEIVHHERQITMTPKQKSLYKKCIKDVEVEMPSGEVLIIENGLVAATRAMQCSAGQMDMVDGEVVLSLPSPKVTELWNFWNDIDREPIVVFAGGPGSRKLLDLTAEFLEGKKIPYRMVVGGLSEHQRIVAVDDYMHGEVDIILCQTTAAGEGLDLDRGNVLVWLQIPWSRTEYTQALHRVRRYTQDADVVKIVSIFFEDGFDPRLLEVMEDKNVNFDEFVKDESKLRKML